MSQSPAPKPSDVNKAVSQLNVYSERALTMMRTLHVMPAPKNYAVFFACSAGQPTDLIHEIEKIATAKQGFSDEQLDTLYNTYIAEGNTRAVQSSANNAKRILTDMLQSIAHFEGDTTAMSQDVEKHLVQLDDDADADMVRSVAQSLIQSAISMQTSSENMTARLAGAQQEITELRETLARVTTEAERDFLTGSFNRKVFDRRLAETMYTAKQDREELTLMMIDIDHFKKFNDSFGHLIGDEVLKTVAKTLAETLKGMDIVARYGGEEFGVILPRTPALGGAVVAEEIRKTIARRELTRKSTKESFGVITVSIGVAAFHPEDTSESFIARADRALYHAKNNGRNRVYRDGQAD